MVKISRNSMAIRRVKKLRRAVKIDTQRLRSNALESLGELFEMSRDLAKDPKSKLKQRQIWARVAAYIAQVINSVASGFDEKQIDTQLDELEKLVNETKAKTKAQGIRGRSEKPHPGREKSNSK